MEAANKQEPEKDQHLTRKEKVSISYYIIYIDSRGGTMNKSYAQSEISMGTGHNLNDDPEYSRDFNSAYNKVIL